MKIFNKDFRSKVFEDEHSPITSQDTKTFIRFNSFDSLDNIFKKVHAEIIVTKPLVEIQNIRSFFHHYPNSRAIWIYRHYKDVTFSNITHFGINNGYNNLQPILENDQDNWRSENLPSSLREVVLKHYTQNIEPYDAAALFWYVRNALFFELDLDKRNDVIMCKYEYFIQNPASDIKRIYKFLQVSYPGDKIVDEVHTRAVGKGKKIQLTSAIDDLCNNLYTKMDQVYQEKLSR